MAARILASLFALLLFTPFGLAADPNDTRLLSMPAISAKHIAFIYADDLWVADRDGKNPRRLTSDIGVESFPCFSPDGSLIAFSAQYEGNTDVYTIPVTGGVPKRLTYHPGQDIVRAFTPDGQSVLFNSSRHVFSNRHAQLFTVPLEGGMPTQLPIPWGFEAAYSPDGQYIAYCPVRDASTVWKHYRGGTHSRIWIYSVKDHETVEIPQPKDRCNDLDPQWIGNRLFFRSDRNGEYNIYSFEPQAKEPKQLTRFTDFPVLDISAGAGTIIFEQAGYLHTLNPDSPEPLRLKIGIAADLVETRPRFAKGAKYARHVAVSPSGARAVVEFRGDIVTVPAEKGDARNLTNSPGAYERDPAWSPDGKTIAYFTDTSGEYELALVPQDGKGKVRTIKLQGTGYYYNPVWSRDSKKILYRDNSQTLYYIDVASGKITKIAEPKYAMEGGLVVSSWSPDSKWVAYSMDTAAHIARVWIYSLEKDKSFPLTDGLSEAQDPVFDASGKYLYFLGSTDTGMSKHGFMQSSGDSRAPRWSLHLAVLRKDLPSPFLRETDEEKGEMPKTGPKPRIAGDDQEPRSKGSDGVEPAKGESKAFTIEFDGIDQRILSFPIQPGSYGSLQAGSAGQVFYLSRPEATGDRRAGPAGGVVMRYDLDRRRSDSVHQGVMAYELTPDGRKMLYASGGGGGGRRGGGDGPSTTWAIASVPGSSGGGGLASLAGGKRSFGTTSGAADLSTTTGLGDAKVLNLDAIEVKVVPEAEWKQIFHEAWRINRDFFYDPNMHGADWPAMEKKYEQFLPHLTSGGDLYKVLGWMLSELAVGHSRYTRGERVYEAKQVKGGLLGADYEVADGRYRFKKIYGGLNWTPQLRSPLTAPGVNVKEGEFLLAVNGTDLKPPTELYSLFENTAGKSIEITVGPTADGKGSRTVTVEPLESEYALRNMEWIEGNLRKVEKATDGKVGYVYVPDTAFQGLTYFKRYFFPQVDKEALIIDERFNSGGQIADYYIDLLRKEPMSRWAPRYGVDWRTPSAAVHGPKVMLIDEGAGSGGDMLPWMFRHFKVGPLVGKRTWGGLVGVSGYPTLMDGGSVTAPSFGFWTAEEGFGVENVGIPPDYDVDIWPKDYIAGKDPQLEKAIELAMKALKDNPPKDDKRPPYPKRAVPK
jgi:tricorn protease